MPKELIRIITRRGSELTINIIDFKGIPFWYAKNVYSSRHTGIKIKTKKVTWLLFTVTKTGPVDGNYLMLGFVIMPIIIRLIINKDYNNV